MRNKFLGDSLDMSKRAAICLLREAGFSLCICPLPSEEDFSEAIYRSCLGLEEGDRVFNPTERFRGNQRENHVIALRKELSEWKPKNTGVAILDPDKGVHDSERRCQYVTVGEVNGLTDVGAGHIIAVYHHRNAGRILPTDLVGRFSARSAVAYDFGAAVLCFVHTEMTNLQRIREVFITKLNRERILPKQMARLGGLT